jgi:hypothetical protein
VDEDQRVVEWLRLAASDMEQAHLAAVSALNPDYKPLRKLLLTAMAVSYARPFTISEGKDRLNLLCLVPDGKQKWKQCCLEPASGTPIALA